jgi:hypothetical protein
MAFANYEELKAAVEARRAETLTLEVDVATPFSQEHEDAKRELQEAKAMKAITGGGFLGDNVAALEERVASTRPASASIFLRYKKLDLVEWSNLMKKAGLQPMDQYEETLPQTFVGLYGQHPDSGTEEQPVEPFTTDPTVASSRHANGLLPGGALHGVVQTYLNWQNSGGEVTIPAGSSP